MNTWIESAGRIVLIGIGATAVMDIWLLLLQRLGVPALNFSMIGRWVGHWRNGQWRHAAIANAGIVATSVAMVSLSTTLATNALVEGQGGRRRVGQRRAGAGQPDSGGDQAIRRTKRVKGQQNFERLGTFIHGHRAISRVLSSAVRHLPAAILAQECVSSFCGMGNRPPTRSGIQAESGLSTKLIRN